jgi:hypothetical protein
VSIDDLVLSETAVWMHSIRLTEIHTAHDWGMSPSQFRALAWEDKAEMVAYDRTISKMQQYDAEQYQKEMKRQNMKNQLKKHG